MIGPTNTRNILVWPFLINSIKNGKVLSMFLMVLKRYEITDFIPHLLNSGYFIFQFHKQEDLITVKRFFAQLLEKRFKT